LQLERRYPAGWTGGILPFFQNLAEKNIEQKEAEIAEESRQVRWSSNFKVEAFAIPPGISQ